jgi:hypothetical protein
MVLSQTSKKAEMNTEKFSMEEAEILNWKHELRKSL